ncbi:unnamed protein product [Cyberlindnera jadinii]|uniref:Cytoplasmic thioredoxin n=1 Tax=Cyberlindnera jadinii (strain ATCC 18201 / CBS 1600 / BCRC 20928 / JCM 3617 / NBRC 0987 / NRRL Y-1542) TaxID=983966 RepID=A0A0H5C3C8_CYBJN|nr:cytoplasmic thioredoxin [Cyberlindnera jadinii NRRL Y-1542]ODV75393.1 cytoplasmic thioredoxin [Cyberlindnera jadinii NRRL Y-1542]CEP22535.1 unnamed protein product [Cyberlindnera jadinii]
MTFGTEAGFVTEISNLEEFQHALRSSRVVVLDFYSTRCGPCDVVAPLYRSVASRFTGARFYQINGLTEPGLEVQKSIDVVWWPTFVIYVNGEEVWRAKIPNPPQEYPTAELESQLAGLF